MVRAAGELGLELETVVRSTSELELELETEECVGHLHGDFPTVQIFVQCAAHSVPCTVYSVQRTRHSVHSVHGVHRHCGPEA